MSSAHIAAVSASPNEKNKIENPVKDFLAYGAIRPKSKPWIILYNTRQTSWFEEVCIADNIKTRKV